MENNNDGISNYMKATIEAIKTGRPCIPSIKEQADMIKLGGVIADSYKYFVLDEGFDVIPINMSLRISYVPLMLALIAFGNADDAIKVIKSRKMYKFKTYTSMYEKYKSQYKSETLEGCHFEVKNGLYQKINSIMEECSGDIQIYYFSAMNEVMKNNKSGFDDEDVRFIVTNISMSINMMKFVRKIDEEYDKMISECMRKTYAEKKKIFNSVVNNMSTINGCLADRHLLSCISNLEKICMEFGYDVHSNMQNTSASILKRKVEEKVDEIGNRLKFKKSFMNEDYDKNKE